MNKHISFFILAMLALAAGCSSGDKSNKDQCKCPEGAVCGALCSSNDDCPANMVCDKSICGICMVRETESDAEASFETDETETLETTETAEELAAEPEATDGDDETAEETETTEEPAESADNPSEETEIEAETGEEELLCSCASDADCPTGYYCKGAPCGEGCFPMPGDGDELDAAETEEESSYQAYTGCMAMALYSLKYDPYTGNQMQLFHISPDGSIAKFGDRITVFDGLVKGAFAPSGKRFLVVNESQEMALYEISAKGAAKLTSAKFEDGYIEEIIFAYDDFAYLLDGNPVNFGGGIKMLNVSDASLSAVPNSISLHAPSGLAVTPSKRYAVVSAGTKIDDPNDTAVVDLLDPQFDSVEFYDFWKEGSSSFDPAFSPDGTLFAMGNNSPFYDDASQIKLFSFSSAGALTFLSSAAVDTPSGFAFTNDGKFLVVSSFEKNLAAVFDVSQSKLTPASTKTGLPLADDVIPIRRGELSGMILISTYDALHLFEIDAAGTLKEKSSVKMDSGMESIIGSVSLGCAE